MTDKPWSELTLEEKKAQVREEAIKSLDWQLANKTPEQVWFLHNKWDHDVNGMMSRPCYNQDKGLGLTQEELSTLCARCKDVRRSCGWKWWLEMRRGCCRCGVEAETH